ncbi:Dolichyl-diphosphooligosaccharide-protein glycosyltransferase 48 kDa subunit [Wickerhamomyces ciferrii]|uniref:Dolichyl-diphosphooligosaccharide--protein glycosyltransferase subunit WBP1 n=1 Tax=Wickerhamomyces ciferrii (strain ATCC 14091 / BCRC 22168 / CBS 111 / JCM 3599 / NBRC 0793 / NRRL Y-1031 F-60-10) TaxID=1206466 RepID=K0KFB4_WICCF|nr:Dolichyl-diphosphooligosaccharide-protein glycosyltransferase 48 kDa subunit [Wickerhamomyces ciferrii]CCH40917.1 Dolichyl-diphosphooligosaccharide-protein glycosyltransferase 48 kDa subunit [Wickerhamomyces ciferrii]
MLLLNGITVLFMAVFTMAVSVLDPATLVIYDPKLTTLDEISQYTESLNQRQFQLTFKEVGETIQLFKNQEKLYSNVIIFPTKLRTIGEEINGAKLLEFFNKGGNILTITNPDGLSESTRTFLNQLGIYPSPRNHALLDHFQYDPKKASDTHDVVKLNSSNVIDNGAIIPKQDGDLEFNYKGSTAILGNGRLIFPILQAPTTSYTKDLKNDDLILENNWSQGTQGYLSVGFQGLNNARAGWIGSDEWFQNGNDDKFGGILIDSLTKWILHETKVIKVTQVEHSHSDGTLYENRPYKIKDEIIYKIAITQWDPETSKWIPFEAADVQLEIKLLDPYHRLNLIPSGILGDSTIYSVKFQLPDHHGVFTFTTNYRRPGLSYIDETNTMAIRHLANDEYPRSWDISNSWVYVTSAVVVFIGWFIFVILFIYSGESSIDGKKEK